MPARIGSGVMAIDPEAQTYSTLEVLVRRPESGIEVIDEVPSPSLTTRSSVNALPVPLSPSPEAASYDDPALVVTSSPQVASAPSTSASSDPFAQWFVQEKIPESTTRRRKICHLRRRYFWSALLISLLVVAITVGVAVGVAVRNGKEQSTTMQDHPVLAPVSSTAPTLSSNTGLASVAWNDTDGVTQHRVYYQDGDGFIRESSWDLVTFTWSPRIEPIGQAKPNTPIAAAVAASTAYSYQINVYALDHLNYVQQWFTRDGNNWKVGPISKKNKLASSSSSLAAAWHGYDGCSNCPENFLVVYQDTNGRFQLGNVTIGLKWRWSELQANPLPGTGIALVLSWLPDGPAGVRLFHQNREMFLCSLDWDAHNPNTGNVTGLWAFKENARITMLPRKAPIAAFAWGFTVEGVPKMVDTLSSGPSGVMVNQWAGSSKTWLKSYSPVPMREAQSYASVAANNNALAYTVWNGTIWEFGLRAKGRRWVATGKVWP